MMTNRKMLHARYFWIVVYTTVKKKQLYISFLPGYHLFALSLSETHTCPHVNIRALLHTCTVSSTGIDSWWPFTSVLCTKPFIGYPYNVILAAWFIQIRGNPRFFIFIFWGMHHIGPGGDTETNSKTAPLLTGYCTLIYFSLFSCGFLLYWLINVLLGKIKQKQETTVNGTTCAQSILLIRCRLVAGTSQTEWTCGRCNKNVFAPNKIQFSSFKF